MYVPAIIVVMVRERLQRIPVQIYLEPKQLDMLRSLAQRRDEPMTHLVRESLERYLVEEIGDDDPLLGLIGMMTAGGPDDAVEHDRVIGEDDLARIEHDARHQRKRPSS